MNLERAIKLGHELRAAWNRERDITERALAIVLLAEEIERLRVELAHAKANGIDYRKF